MNKKNNWTLKIKDKINKIEKRIYSRINLYNIH